MKTAPTTISDALFGSPNAVDIRPRWAAHANPRYVSLRVKEHTVFVRRSALRSMFETSRRHRVEVGFLCMGRRQKDDEGPYTLIEAFPLVGIGGRTNVEMSPEEKIAAQRRYAALDVVGWAHTHPGLGVFFSRTDIENCKQYGPAAINFVLDPVNENLGVALGAAMSPSVPTCELLSSRATRSAQNRRAQKPGQAIAPTVRQSVVLAARPRSGRTRRAVTRLVGMLIALAMCIALWGTTATSAPTAAATPVDDSTSDPSGPSK